MRESNIYLITDQPATCPTCGNRTNFIEVRDGDVHYQLHTCPAQGCGYVFRMEEEGTPYTFSV